MGHWAPKLVSVLPASDGGADVGWEVDDFFEDSEAPDDVFVDLSGFFYPSLGADARSFTIPAADLARFAGSSVDIGVSFKWVGPPDDVMRSNWSVFVGSVGGGVVLPSQLSVGLVDRQPKTTRGANRITIHWGASPYTKGDIIWGPVDNPTAYKKNITPSSAKYNGNFTTDVGLRANTQYHFEVRVQLHGDPPFSSSIDVRSASNFRSLRAYLGASGLPAGSVRAALRHGGSLRGELGV